MSSILKALKKLESQATDQNQVRIWRPQNLVQNEDHEQINGHLHLKKGYVVMLAGLFLAVGAGFLLSNKLYEKKPQFITKKETIIEKPAPLPKNMAVIPDKKAMPKKPAPLPKNTAVMPDKKAMPKKSTPPPKNRAVMSAPGPKKLSSREQIKKFEPTAKVAKKVPRLVHKSRRNSAVLFDKKTLPLKQVRNKTIVEKSSKKSVQSREEDRFLSMPVKRSNQTKIEVQAIAWSKDPKGRLAVINGLILREGESIDNIMVMHIGKDAVVFRKGGEGWKQIFGF